MFRIVLQYVAYVWIIIVGGLMITPNGVFCIACGVAGTRSMGVFSIVVGIAGLLAAQRRSVASVAAVSEPETGDDERRPALSGVHAIRDYRRGRDDTPATANSKEAVAPPRGPLPERQGGSR